jgi:hypothetical protein
MYQSSTAEVTVAIQLHQGVTEKWAVHHFSGSFFFTFLDKQKSKEEGTITL